MDEKGSTVDKGSEVPQGPEGSEEEKRKKEKEFWMIMLFIPIAVIIIGLMPFLADLMPTPEFHKMVPWMNPHVFFFTFVFIPMFVAVLLCVISAGKAMKEMMREV